jgi:hypothetical protein
VRIIIRGYTGRGRVSLHLTTRWTFGRPDTLRNYFYSWFLFLFWKLSGQTISQDLFENCFVCTTMCVRIPFTSYKQMWQNAFLSYKLHLHCEYIIFRGEGTFFLVHFLTILITLYSASLFHRKDWGFCSGQNDNKGVEGLIWEVVA